MFGPTIYINRIRENLCKNTKILTVKSLVLSNLKYCIKVWGSTNATQLQKVQEVQNFAAKVELGGSQA